MGNSKLFCVFCCVFVFTNFSLIAQNDQISLDSLDLKNTKILFEEYVSIGKFCENSKAMPIHCDKESKLFDNNIEVLKAQHLEATEYLDIPYEIITKEELSKKIYEDKTLYRYVFEYTPTIGKKLNSCLSNPGSLLIKFSVFDRLENKHYELDLKYMIFICDIQILINEINKSIKEEK